MNYTLTLNLEGADKTDAALSSLLDKVSKISSNPKISFKDWLEYPKDLESDAGNAGEKSGKSFAKSFKQYGMADLAKLFSKQGFASPQTPDWMNNKFFNPEQKLDKLKILTAGIATLFNPFVGARMLSDIIPKDHMSGGKGLTGAIFGAAGAAGYTEIFVVVKLLQTAFKALVASIKQTVQAYDDARKLYAKSLTSGLGLNFTVKRSMLADILGVSETEVIRFGSAWNYLNQRISFASDQLAKTATPLAGVGWEFKIMEKNVKALWSEIAMGVAPAIKALISEFNDFLSTFGQTQSLTAIGTIISKTIQQAVNLIGLIEIIVNTQYVGYRLIFDSIKYLVSKTIDLIISSVPGASKYVANSLNSSVIALDMQKVTKSWTDEVKNWAKNLNGASLNNTPSPQAWMKQLPASTWEKMGLVTMGGSQNYSKEISKNTREMATGIRMIVASMKKGKSNPSFGMSPNTAQP